VVLALPVGVLAVQVLAALWPARRREAPAALARPSLAVLVPAHNEALGIAATLRALKAQLRPGDAVWVVADNCSDDTAERARTEGVRVIERRHATLRGKGFALAFGVDHLRAAPPEQVVIVDADCLVQPGALDALAACCKHHGAPAQALYLMQSGAAPSLNRRIAEFAWRVKNWVRPRGAARLGLPCQLMGTGMAFPWPLLAQARLANASIVEDMLLGVELAQAGHAPVFCEAARVTSQFPDSAAATASQRTRWEHGHLGLILHHAPGLLGSALRRRDRALLGLALDLAVPPLALLVWLIAGAWAVTALAAWAGVGRGPWYAATGLLAVLAAAVGAAWWRWGRPVLSLMDLLSVPWYVASKMGVYLRFWSNRQKDWVRTDRE
jgi:hypothetical protein